MQMISVAEFCELLGQSLSSGEAYDTVLDVVQGCTKYEMDDEVMGAINMLREYFNRERNYWE